MSFTHHSLPLPRPGPPGHQQLLPGQDELQPGAALLHLHHGAPPLRPMPYDPQLQGKPDPRKLVAGEPVGALSYEPKPVIQCSLL